MPPTSGFFFGGTAVDEFYAQDLRDTIEQVEKALKIEGVDFYYRSNW